MENPKFLKRRAIAVAKAALTGGSLFGLITVAVVIGARLFMHGKKGEFLPDVFTGLLFVVFTPALSLQEVLGLQGKPATHFVNGITFGALVNFTLGAMVFGLIAAFWQLLIRERDED